MPILIHWIRLSRTSKPDISPETRFREEVQAITKVLTALSPSESVEWVDGLQKKTKQALKALQKELKEWGI
jgi:hypothetical protein